MVCSRDTSAVGTSGLTLLGGDRETFADIIWPRLWEIPRNGYRTRYTYYSLVDNILCIKSILLYSLYYNISTFF